jgi:biofilm protein TabA
MILDKIENLEKYASLNSRFKKAFAWFRKADFSKLDFGKVVIEEGQNGEANIRVHIDPVYKTKPLYKTNYEGHKKYIDVQIVLDGREKCQYAPLKGDEEEVIAYVDTNEYYKVNANEMAEFYLEVGNFAIFFPGDLHRPCISIAGEEKDIRKIVLKIKVD